MEKQLSETLMSTCTNCGNVYPVVITYQDSDNYTVNANCPLCGCGTSKIKVKVPKNCYGVYGTLK